MKFDVTGAVQFMVLAEGTVPTPTKAADLEVMRAAEPITGGAARNVLPGPWTLILMRQQGLAREIAAHPFQVSARPEQEVKVTPQWRAIVLE